MPYPDIFYYQAKGINKAYSYIPQGQLVVNQFINGKPYWLNNTLSKKTQKKTLLLADWSAGSWKREEVKAYKQILEQLLDDGFVISYWNGYSLYPFSKQDIAKLDIGHFRFKLSPDSYQ